MNIFEYAKNYGKYSFEEKKFNEVDNIVFSLLCYVNFNGIVSNSFRNKKTISEVATKFFMINNEYTISKYPFEAREAIKLLDIVKNQKRYKDIKVFNYTDIVNETTQFSATTFKIDKKNYYIAFRGTDESMIGWKENFQMGYKFPVDAHLLAKKYLNKFSYKIGKLIVGGHSKGGNLALAGALLSNKKVKNKIINIYSNDGQGLLIEELNSKNYNLIKNKYIHIIPNYSVVGLLLENEDNYKIIKSNKKGIMAHNASTWQIEDDHFESASLSAYSKNFRDGFHLWLSKSNYEQRKMFVNELFKVAFENNIVSFNQIKQQKKLIFDMVKTSKTVNPIVKEMLGNLINNLNKTTVESLFGGEKNEK